MRLCGLDDLHAPETIEQAAVSPPALDPAAWLRAAEGLDRGSKTDEDRACQMRRAAEAVRLGRPALDEAKAVFFTADGSPRAAGASGKRAASDGSAANARSTAAHKVSINTRFGNSSPPPIL